MPTIERCTAKRRACIIIWKRCLEAADLDLVVAALYRVGEFGAALYRSGILSLEAFQGFRDVAAR